MNTTVRVDQTKSDTHMFIGAVLNLSWQMAIVVLVPIVGGYELDKKFHVSPLLTIIGFGVATFGVVIVLWNQLQRFTPPNSTTGSQQS